MGEIILQKHKWSGNEKVPTPAGFVQYATDNKSSIKELMARFGRSYAVTKRWLEDEGLTPFLDCKHCGRIPSTEFNTANRKSGLCSRDHRGNHYVTARKHGAPRKLLYELAKELTVREIEEKYYINDNQIRAALYRWGMRAVPCAKGPVILKKAAWPDPEHLALHFERWVPRGESLNGPCLPMTETLPSG